MHTRRPAHWPSRSLCLAFLVYAPALLAEQTVSVPAVNPPSASYRVEIGAIQPAPRATVTARMDVSDGLLAMATGGGIDHLPNEWTTFVHNLTVNRADGGELAVEHIGPEGWRILGDHQGEVRVRYEVDLGFCLESWPPGNEQAGLVAGESLFMVTKPLFLTSSVEGPLDVTFAVPDDWKISTPWQPLEASRSYRAKNRLDLSENSIVLGHHDEYNFSEGQFSLTLALIGPISSSRELLSSTLGSAVRHALAVFPSTTMDRFLMTVFLAEQDDGESFESSAAFTVALPPTPDSIMLWGNNLAHELYHLWIGGQIHAADNDDHEWFDEGFTDYYADLALAQTGMASEEMFFRKMEKVIGRYVYTKYSSLFPAQSLAEASSNKGRYRFAVYDGGWVAAFCLDTSILAASEGARSLDDVMRSLYDRFAIPDHSFTLEELQQRASEVARLDFTEFFSRHVHGSEILPVEDCLHAIGLEGYFQPYAAELWLTQREGAGEAERKLRRWIVDGRQRH